MQRYHRPWEEYSINSNTSASWDIPLLLSGEGRSSRQVWPVNESGHYIRVLVCLLCFPLLMLWSPSISVGRLLTKSVRDILDPVDSWIGSSFGCRIRMHFIEHLRLFPRLYLFVMGSWEQEITSHTDLHFSGSKTLAFHVSRNHIK